MMRHLLWGLMFLACAALLWLTASVYFIMRRVLFVLAGGCL